MTKLRAIVWTEPQIATLRKYAEDHPMSVKAVMAGECPCAGDIPGHTLDLGGGVKVVYSIESDQPAGPCRHLSLSVSGSGKWPNPVVVQLLGKELGFRPDLQDGDVWQDEENEAVNWVQLKDLLN